MANQNWLWPSLKTLLLDDFEKLHAAVGNWDLVIFSGDLTQRGSAEEFEKLDTVLQEMWTRFKRLGFTPSLFVVPGNHDVQWPARNGTVRTLRRWWDEPDVQGEFFDNPANEYLDLVGHAFSNFNGWIQRHANRDFGLLQQTSGLLPGDGSAIMTNSGIRVGLVGLNSTWLQLDDGNYEGQLHVDTKQLLSVTAQDPDVWCSKNEINLLVTHHPASWLHRRSLSYWQSELHPPGRFTAHLFGHVHQPSALSAGQGGSPTQISIQGVSTFGLAKLSDQMERNHGYSVTRYAQAPDPMLKVWPRRLYKNIGAGNNIGPETGFPLNNDNSFIISLPSRRKAASVLEPSATLTDIPLSGTLREALQEAEYPLPPHSAAQNVRVVEQKALLAALNSQRVGWLVAEWGMGEDGFASSVRRQTHLDDAPVYRLDMVEFRNRSQFSQALKEQLNCTFERFCQLISETGECWLLLDNLLERLDSSDDQLSQTTQIEDLSRLLLEYCPKLHLLLRSRRPPISPSFHVIEIKALDEADIRSYVNDHELRGTLTDDLAVIGLITRHTDGIPTRIDQTLTELQVVSLSDLVRSDFEFSELPTKDQSPDALVQTIRQLATAKDPGDQRAFSLLKVLTMFPQGETLARVRRFHATYQFFPANAAALRTRGLVEVLATSGFDLTAFDQTEKRLKVSLPVRECTWERLKPAERFELNRRAAEIYFGSNWSSGLFKPPPSYHFDRPNCQTADISNANTILIRLFRESISLGDANLMTRVLGLADVYLRSLDRGDHYRNSAELCHDLLPMIPTEGFEEKIASISARYATSLRMIGEELKAISVIQGIIDYPFSNSDKQDLLLDLALCYDDLDDFDNARKIAKELIEINARSDTSLQAEALLVELQTEDPDRLQKLVVIEARARKREAIVVANNIAIVRARQGDNSPREVRAILDPIIGSNNKTDSYNKLRAAVELAEISFENDEALTEAEEKYLIGAYHFNFNERLPVLFERFHEALWNIFESRRDYRNLFVLFRHSSLYWRLRDNKIDELNYLKQLAVVVERGIAQQLTGLARELAYYQIRSDALPREALSSEELQADDEPED
jgi:Calcineurin-like phosphoesterase